MKRNYTSSKTLPRTSKVPVSTSGQREYATLSLQKKFSSELVPNDRRGKIQLPKNGTSVSIADDCTLAKYDRMVMMVESTNNYVDGKVEAPLSDVYCTGQQLVVRGGEPSNNTKVLEKSLGNSETFAQIGGHKGTQSIALNKLYSSLKKLKSRHNSPTGRDVQRDVRSRCLSFPFKNCKGFGQHELSNGDIGEEEIFILLGGKSKPVRFEVNPDNLNLVENEFGLKLKSKSITASFDQEDYELLKKFREKYRTGVPRNESPFVPWARHAVFRSRKANVLPNDNEKTKRGSALPCATYEVEEEEFGRKLSIHVYLPNIVPSNN